MNYSSLIWFDACFEIPQKKKISNIYFLNFFFQIESFVFNDENDEELDFNNMTEAEFIKRYDINLDLINNKNHKKDTTNKNDISNETVTIDSDTRIKLETLLANAGQFELNFVKIFSFLFNNYFFFLQVLNRLRMIC